MDTVGLRSSFLFSYLVLFSSMFITLIESLRTKNIRSRHILNLETSVSMVATFVYSVFLKMLDKPDTNLEDITRYRYMDWFITTPMLLLAILLFFHFYQRNELPVQLYLWIMLLNTGMLVAGYLGETRKLHRNTASLVGFGFFLAMLALMWFGVVVKSGVEHHKVVFLVFVVVWTMYGVAYFLEPTQKNVAYNTLDVISKSLFGVFMWLYYGHVVSF